MRILYISYFYPPLGGPAALRNQKTISYLRQSGAEIHVISIQDIEYTYYDDSLSCHENSILRTKSLDPMAILKRAFSFRPQSATSIYKNSPERLKLFIRRLYPIDEKIGWLPYLIPASIKTLKQKPFDLIFVSCGPFSSAIGAWYLSKRFKLPLVIDYRDYWTLLSDYDLWGNRFSLAFSRYCEKKLIQDSRLLVCATQGIRNDLAFSFGKNLLHKSFVLYNGHDEADFRGLQSAKPAPNEFTLAYFGNIYARRSLKHLYQALYELNNEEMLPPNTSVQLYGNFNKETLQEIADSPIPEMIQTLPQLSHSAALHAMGQSHALILIINSSSPKGTLTSKVFEYLRLARPILAMVPAQGEAAELLRECGIDTICPMESTSAIKACLIKLFQSEATELNLSPHLSAYERSSQISELYKVLAEISG